MTTDPAAIAQRIPAHEKDLGGFVVGRVIPVARRRALGPFVFLDHMGPATLAPGEGFDVRPHPHIGLSTLTYLFDGAVMHRDSLGVTQEIRPGEVNLMTAGRGVVHSERAPEALRRDGGRLHGLQFWLALPAAQEDCEPGFAHRDAHELPALRSPGLIARVIAGSLEGLASPLAFPTRTRLVDVQLDDGAAFTVPAWEGEERGVYTVEGAVTIDGEDLPARTLGVLVADRAVTVRAQGSARIFVVGGAPLDGPREMVWNFVATTRARIAAARDAWIARRFPTVPGDEVEFIPYPQEGRSP
ncbi:MAG: pirin family protein [Polyangiales bacterium]